MITDGDIARMVEACRQLPEPTGNYIEDDFLVNLVSTVVDFQTQTTAVERAIGHFKDRARPQLRDLDDLMDLLDRWPNDREGNTALAQHLWGYKMWTRAQMLRGLVAYFVGIGVTDQKTLRQWAEKATFADFHGRVRGLGPAVFQWLVMRQGIDTVKPDVHVHRYVAAVLGRRVTDEDAVRVVTEAARQLGRSATRIDWAIWEAGRADLWTAPVKLKGSPAGVGKSGLNGIDPAAVGSKNPPRGPETAFAVPADGIVSFLDDDDGYLDWLNTHSDGFVLNSARRPTGRYLVVHRTECPTISPESAKTWTIAYRKTCASALSDLVRWANEVAGEPVACRVCKPIL